MHLAMSFQKIALVMLVVVALLASGAWLFTYTNVEHHIEEQQEKGNSLLSPQNNFETILVGSTEIDVKLLTSRAEIVRGLSGTKSISAREGRLFVFGKPDFYHIWMKDMLFSIDIVWISADGEIVKIKKDVDPSTYPEAFTSEVPAQYVLEVNSGSSEKYNWVEGTQVELPPSIQQ